MSEANPLTAIGVEAERLGIGPVYHAIVKAYLYQLRATEPGSKEAAVFLRDMTKLILDLDDAEDLSEREALLEEVKQWFSQQ